MVKENEVVKHTKDELKSMMLNAELIGDLHYVTDSKGQKPNFDFQPRNLAAGVIVKAYLEQEAGNAIEGSKITATFLSSTDKTSDKVPNDAVDLITFNLTTERQKNDGTDFKTDKAKYKEEEITFPAAIFTEQTLEKLQASGMDNGSIGAHYDKRKETHLNGHKREDSTVKNVAGEDVFVGGLDTMYNNATVAILSNPLLTSAAIEILEPKVLLNTGNDEHKAFTDYDKVMPPEVFSAYDKAQDAALAASFENRKAKIEASKANSLISTEEKQHSGTISPQPSKATVLSQ